MSEIFSRNQYIVDSSLQKKLDVCKLGFVGCGLGSNIAILSARLGIKHFFLADGDRVELSNLNRQEFNINDLGENKAVALRGHIKMLSSKSLVRIIPRYIVSQKEIDRLVKFSDVIFNTADFSKGFFQVLDSVYRQDKIAISPFNVGYGSAITVFCKKNLSKLIFEEVNFRSELEGFSLLLSKAQHHYSMPRYFQKVFKEIQKEKVSFIPQIGIASEISAALSLFLVTAYLRGESLPLYPEALSVDLIEKWLK